jgi:hypothetical protein
MVLLAAPVAMAAIAGGRTAGGGEDPRARRSRMVHFGGALVGALLAAWVPTLAWGWDSLAPAPGGTAGPGGLGPGWVLARSLDGGLAGWLLGSGRPLVLAAAVLPAVVWVRRRPRRAYATVGLLLLAPLALGPAWSPRDLVWPAVFGYLGDARWASIYAAAAGATVVWASTWWATELPWHGGVAPGTVPDATAAALGLVTWVVLASWLAIGWRTVIVESGSGKAEAGAMAEVGGEAEVRDEAEVVDNSGTLVSRSATLPPGGLDAGPGHAGTPANGAANGQANGSANGSGNGLAQVGEGTSPSRGSVSLPK